MKKLIETLERKLLEGFGTIFLTFPQVDFMIKNLAEQVKEYNPDCTLAILKSGAYPGRKLTSLIGGDYQEIEISRESRSIFGIPIKDIVAVGKMVARISPYKLNVSGEFKDKNYKRILLVDEECASGATFNLAKEIVRSKNKNADIREAVVHVCPGNHTPTYFFEKTIPLNRFIGRTTRFPWASYSPYFDQYADRLKSMV